VNPVDDAIMRVTHVLRGEDLLSSTPRQIALYHAMIDAGVATHIPRFGHLPYVMGEGNKKLSKRDPESNLFHHRDRGFIPEGLLNYLALLGWSISADRDVFSLHEMATAFDVTDVNPNPARFDVKKAEAINGDHIRLLSIDEFTRRLAVTLQSAGLLPGNPGDPVSDTEFTVLAQAAPLVQTRMNLLGEAPAMLAFLFTTADELTWDEDALAGLPDNTSEVISRGRAVLADLDDDAWQTPAIQAALEHELIEAMELKPRIAYGPLRTAISGKRISPPLFESMEILGRDETLARLERFSLR
ncbi:MAG: glutamate--tRNA ligase, partial [Microbacteriaceae bacterium]|nr:glutamate--tRNA ligase [Microbacteriaceae bacterium]